MKEKLPCIIKRKQLYGALMFIKTRVLDDSGNTVFQAKTEINAQNLIEVAKSREDLARSKGADWTAGAIPFYGGELIEVMKAGQLGKEVDRAAIEVAMVAWLFDSIYCGVDAKTFLRCDLEFTMLPGGAVKYDRHPRP